LLNHEGAYGAGTPLDAAWTLGVACAAIWVDGVTRREPDLPPAAARARMLPVPAFAVLAGLGVLLVATQNPVPAVALILAAAVVALAAVPVMFRHATLARLFEGQEHVVRRLEELDKTKSAMIATLSHEIRTPLTPILGYLDLVLDDDANLPVHARDRLRIVARNADRLQHLADNMLLLTGIESGAAQPSRAPVEIGQILQRVQEALGPFAASRDVELTVVGDREAIVAGDEDQLERALSNVIQNALKFTPAGGTVHVQAVPGIATTGQPTVTIGIADTGMGIPADELPNLFDRFFRATNAQDQAVQGTGLGLAIVREIVQAHDGEISVSSVLGYGTAVRITLPVLRDADDSR
jgi:signal transduction histidine kinase